MSETVENRNVFGLHGIGGALIAVVLLLSILGGLTFWGLMVQQTEAANYYEIQNVQDLQTINDGKSSADYVVDYSAKK